MSETLSEFFSFNSNLRCETLGRLIDVFNLVGNREAGIGFDTKRKLASLTVEQSLFASECEHGRLHNSPDVAVVEILRPDGTPCAPGEAGEPAELVLFTVKTYDTTTALAALKPAVGPGTAVLTLQNGVDSVDLLSAALGRARVLAGVTYVASGVAEPGVIQENGFSRKVVIGDLRSYLPRIKA